MEEYDPDSGVELRPGDAGYAAAARSRPIFSAVVEAPLSLIK